MSNPISPKVTASTMAAAVATLIVWGLNSGAGIDVPTGVEGAFVVLLTFAVGYVVRDPQRENVPQAGTQAPNPGRFEDGD